MNQASWGADCRGMSQSPVELQERLFLEKRDEGELDFNYYQPTPPAQLIDNGKFLAIKFTADPGYVTWREKNYHLTEIQFHSIGFGSGHNVKFLGDPFAEFLLEMHSHEIELIHITPEGDQIALSLLCSGIEHGLVPWFDTLATELTTLSEAALTGATHIEMLEPPNMFEFVNPQNYDTPDWSMFWDYDGSLTTPPCTEGVRRFVSGDECLLSKGFVQGLEGFETMMGNARQVQATWNRILHYNSTHWKPEEPEDINVVARILLPIAVVCAVLTILCLCCKIAFTDPECCDKCMNYVFLCCKQSHYFCCIFLGPCWLCCINCVRHSLYLPEYKENPFTAENQTYHEFKQDDRYRDDIKMDGTRRRASSHETGQSVRFDGPAYGRAGRQRGRDEPFLEHSGARPPPEPASRNIYDTPYEPPRASRNFSENPSRKYSENAPRNFPEDRYRQPQTYPRHSEPSHDRNHTYQSEPNHDRNQPYRSAFTRGTGDREYSPYDDMRNSQPPPPGIGGVRSRSEQAPHHQHNPYSETKQFSNRVSYSTGRSLAHHDPVHSDGTLTRPHSRPLTVYSDGPRNPGPDYYSDPYRRTGESDYNFDKRSRESARIRDFPPNSQYRRDHNYE